MTFCKHESDSRCLHFFTTISPAPAILSSFSYKSGYCPNITPSVTQFFAEALFEGLACAQVHISLGASWEAPRSPEQAPEPYQLNQLCQSRLIRASRARSEASGGIDLLRLRPARVIGLASLRPTRLDYARTLFVPQFTLLYLHAWSGELREGASLVYSPPSFTLNGKSTRNYGAFIDTGRQSTAPFCLVS